MFLILIISSIFLLALYIFYNERRNRDYFESKGIYYKGNGLLRLIVNIFKGTSMMQDVIDQYQIVKGKDQKLAGSIDFGTVNLFITDVHFIRSCLVKDFEHFVNRRSMVLPNDFVLKKMLFFLRDDPWKSLRSKLSPTFTTGKIKRLFHLFNESGKKLAIFIENEMKGQDEIDLAEGYSKYTMDVIASAACAIDSQAFDQKEPSLFERMGKKMQLSIGGKELLKVIVIFTSPRLGQLLGLSFFTKDVQDFFSQAIKSVIAQREKGNERRDDFIQLMLEARAGKLKTDESELDNFEKDAMLKDSNNRKTSEDDLLDDEGIVANALLFMLAGFDTTQSLLLFTAYTLALNQDVQDRLREEVENTLEENNGEFTYDSINKMTYLDMVLNETLRMYPPQPFTDRMCTKDYKVEGSEFVLKKGQTIFVPVWGLHYDHNYWANPYKFDPLRFSSENKHKINQYAYLPFGQGPRNCIGMRFAMTEVRTAIAHLVHNFKIEPSKKTLIPMKFAKASSLKPDGGMFLSLNKIEH